jgi:hypothetical protein
MSNYVFFVGTIESNKKVKDRHGCVLAQSKYLKRSCTEGMFSSVPNGTQNLNICLCGNFEMEQMILSVSGRFRGFFARESQIVDINKVFP